MVLAAKVAEFGTDSLVVSEVVALAAYLLAQAVLTSPATRTTSSSPGAPRAVVGSGLDLCLLGLFALGPATIIRHTAGATSTVRGILLVLPVIVRALPSSIAAPAEKFLPDHLGGAIVPLDLGDAFPPWLGLLRCGDAVVALSIGAVAFVRRGT